MIYSWYSVARKCYLKHIPLVPQLIKVLIRILWGGVVPYQCQIGAGTVFAYQALGVVLRKRAVIGEGCRIQQNVTIGGTSGKENVPVLGDRVQVGAGAMVLGPIHVGDDAVIGANAVVTKDIPANAVVAGVPAKIIRFREPNDGMTI